METFDIDVLVTKLEDADFAVFDCGNGKYAIKSEKTGAFILRDGTVDDLRKYADGLGILNSERPLYRTDTFEFRKRVFRERESGYQAHTPDF